MFQRIRFLPIHPFLFAMYPLVFLYANNAGNTDLEVLTRPVLTVAIVTVCLVILCWAIVRDMRVACSMASTAVIAFFILWSPITKDLLVADVAIPGWSPVIPKIAYIAIVSILIFWFGFKRPSPLPVTFAFNATAFAMIVMALLPLRTELSAKFEADGPRTVASLVVEPDPEGPMGPRPNVFFIILDAYGRRDVLLDEFDYDNSPFLNSMQEKGFFVVPKSQADYPYTLMSVPSCLQMVRVDDFDMARQGGKSLRHMMYDGPVHDTFRAQRYSVCAISTGFSPIEPTLAVDVLVRPGFFAPMAGEFEAHVLNRTPLPDFFQSVGIDLVNHMWRQKILHSIRNIHAPLMMDVEKPIFVQAHILSPHNPYVFDAEGNPYEPTTEFALDETGQSNQETRRREYIAQLQGLNGFIEREIDLILAESTSPPVIVIISDHGPPASLTTEAGRLANLCMLHLPGIEPDQIPQDLHLVNLFRLLFNLYFEAELPMLDDIA